MKPNILLLVADQFRGDCLGCAGNEVIETPYLDELASQGFLFTSAYSAVPSCIPARSILMTGMNQWHTGVLGMGPGMGKMPSNFKYTIPGILSANGYHTQGIGKMHFSPQRALNGFHRTEIDESGRVEEQGFVSDYREWFERNKPEGYGYRDHSLGWNSWMARPSHLPEWLHSTSWTTDQAISFLGKRDPEKPFFLKVSYNRPHSPYDPPQVYYDMYKDVKMPEPYMGDWANQNLDEKESRKTDAWRGRRSRREIQRARACYYASITFVDHQIGKLFYEMKKSGIYDDTVIMFVSDHGDMLGDHNLWRKTYAYEGSSKIPWIVKMPEQYQGETGLRIDKPVELMDVMPTLLDMAGVDIPISCDGKSVFPLIKKEDIPWRRYIHGEHCLCYHREQEQHYITDGIYKYIWLDNINCRQFFDLKKDPGELYNAINDDTYAEVIRDFEGFLMAELEKRNWGLVLNGKLVPKVSDMNLTSPNYKTYFCYDEQDV